MADSPDTPAQTSEAPNETPKTPLADIVWNQIAASMDYQIYVLNAVRERFLQVSDDPKVALFYREDARKNFALMNEAELHFITALQLIKQALPILSAKFENAEASTNSTEELPETPSVLVN